MLHQVTASRKGRQWQDWLRYPLRLDKKVAPGGQSGVLEAGTVLLHAPGNGRYQQHLVAIPEGIVCAAQEANVFLINVDI